MVSAAGMPLLRGSVSMKIMMTVVALIPLFLMSLFLDPTEAKHVKYPTFDRSSLRPAEVGVPPATSALAGHSKKKGPEALPIGSPKSSGGATVAPWRPPVVNFQYQGGPVMTRPIKCIFIWYASPNVRDRMVIHVIFGFSFRGALSIEIITIATTTTSVLLFHLGS